MGVPAELLGRQVRCPHCKQVVVAPTSAGPNPAPAPVPVPPQSPTPPAPELAPQTVAVAPAPVPPPQPPVELRPFNLPSQKEGADSILSEPDESDDEVFGSNPGSRLRTLPREPLPEPAPPAPANPFVVKPTAVPVPMPLPQPVPAPANLEPLPQPVAAPRPQPVPVPLPAPVAPVPAPANGDPFGAFDAPPQPVSARTGPADELPDAHEDGRPKKKKKKRDADANEPDETPAKPSYGRADAGSGTGKTILLVLLAGYAFVATLLAVYGLFFSSGTPAGHPLSTIPDNFGEFDPVTRKKVTKATFPVDGPLPPELRAPLGGKVAVGQLEVQPVRIEKRALVIQLEDANGQEKRTAPTRDKALVLTLDIKNTSPDLSIFPVDPAFIRRESKDDQPITRLVTGKKSYAGGEIEWPLGKAIKKKAEVQQANDAIPLKPGESREYVVFTPASAELVRTAEADKGPLHWRVQLRRGLIDYKGKEVPVTAVVGVDFRASDIQTPGAQ